MNFDQRRRTDSLVAKCGALWDWFDKRQIDRHTASLLIFWITWKITTWAMTFASAEARPGLEVAAIIGAVTAPWAAVQGAAIKFYFDSRDK